MLRSDLSRRDFINGVLIASSSLAGGPLGPIWSSTGAAQSSPCDGDIGRDPRALRGGNLPSTFNIAHWLRDGRLGFDRNSVTLAPGCDGLDGRFAISDASETVDVVIVGAGLSGLTAAYCLLRERPGTRILLLDANRQAGGNAARDEAAPLPVPAATAGSYCVAPTSDFQKDLYHALGIDWERHRIEAPVYSYYFDASTPGIEPGVRGWNLDTYGKGLEDVPYPRKIVEDLIRCRDEFRRWARTEGAPTDPPEASSEQFDDLTGLSLAAYLTDVLRCDPVVADFYTRYTIDALGGTAAQVNAHSAISFLAAEYGELFTFPGGTSELASRLLHRLGPSVEIRLEAVALRVDDGDHLAGREASVTYVEEQMFHRVRARAIILACPSVSAKHLVAHLSDDARSKAWPALNTVPVAVANVGLRRAAPLVELGLGYNQYWWGSRFWADFLVADWTNDNRADPDRPTVLTFLGGNSVPPEALAEERMRLLHTPFSAYETSIEEDLSRLLSGTNFDAARDITSISLYRWGHGMILPTTRSLFGDARGRISDRAKASRRVAFAPLGAIAFAGQESEGTPSVESATASGRRAAFEVLARL